MTASELPPTASRYSAQRIIYNAMGRVVKQSNPTETNDSWAPSGDDSAWFDTEQVYDWKGRPTVTTNADGTTRVASYGGCGCAGGEVATVQDEHGRQRRFTKDTFGRLWKVEELNWNTTVYATTTYSYNSRDQLTQSNQAGQLRSMAYDGYGRLQTRTTPEQGVMSYSYNTDNTTNFVTDARGAKTIFAHNPRHLVTGTNYDLSNLVPGQSVAPTANVSFTYDAVGNRRTMVDGMGDVTYEYDNLSQLTAETRAFNGLEAYTLIYSYNLAGELTSIINDAEKVDYSYDKVGRVTGVTKPNSVTYASGLAYRAFGAFKGMNYGDGKSLSALYDNRMRPTRWDVSNTLGYNYDYDHLDEHTGRVTYAQSIHDAALDRSYEYDQVGRLAISHSGAEARAHAYSGQWGTMDGPYSQGYDYDVWGNVTHKYGWGGEVHGGGASQTSDIYYAYTNNRRNGFSYDAAGNLTNDLGQTFTYDATGQQATAAYGGYSLQQNYDGDGLRVKKNDNGTVTYYLRSSVLGGQVVAEINASGVVARIYTYLGSQLLALRNPAEKGSGTHWVHEDPITKSKRVTSSAGTVVSTIELDPWGADTTRSSNSAFQPRKFTTYDRDGNGSDEAMFRRSNRWHSRFDQPDPYDGSYSPTNPQSFNRYAYVENDPVNFVDPTGLVMRCFELHGAEGVVVDQFCMDIPDPGPLVPRGNGGASGGGKTQQQQHCRDVAGLAPENSNEGALARLIFQEATGTSVIGVGQSQANEVNAISSIVQNRAAYLNTPGLKQGQTFGFGNVGASVADVVYSRGKNPDGKSDISTQFAGFTPGGISRGVQDRLNHALNSDVASDECFGLLSAIVAARSSIDPFSQQGGTFGMRTAGSKPLGSPFFSLPQIAGSGNVFFGLKR